MRADQRTALFMIDERSAAAAHAGDPTPRAPGTASSRRVAAAAVVWGLLVAAGVGLMMRYGHTRGTPASAAPIDLASGTGTSELPTHRPGVPLLLVFAHPKCPCTRATLDELDRLLASVRVRPDVVVVFVRPDEEPAGWEQGELWQSAARLPGVSVRVDVNGAVAAHFGAVTSGQVLLYDADGHLAFAGGITAARGHAGDNAGSDAIAALLAGAGPAPRATTIAQTPVFGCALGRCSAPTPAAPTPTTTTTTTTTTKSRTETETETGVGQRTRTSRPTGA